LVVLFERKKERKEKKEHSRNILHTTKLSFRRSFHGTQLMTAVIVHFYIVVGYYLLRDTLSHGNRSEG